jgi:hypothetical protein
MHLVYYHLHFLCYGPLGLVKFPQTFSLYPILPVFLHGVAD